MTRKSKPGYENSYWCCAADFRKHEADCPNAPVSSQAPAPQKGLPQTAEEWHEFYTEKIRSHAWVTGVRVNDWGDGSFEDVLNAYGEGEARRLAEVANFRQSSSLAEHGAESAEIGKKDTADKKSVYLDLDKYQ